MDKELIATTLKNLKESSPKRNFKQSFDLIINLKGIDLKKQDHQVDAFITLPHARGKKAKVCALVGPELEGQAKQVCDSAITSDSFDKYKEKKEVNNEHISSDPVDIVHISARNV